MLVSAPLKTINSLNGREHPLQRARRVKKEREAIAWVLAGHKPPEGPVTVLMRRISPSNKGLDAHDGLPAALKAPVDQVAAWLGRDDSDPSITWRYAQRPGGKNGWGVEIEVSQP